HGDDFVGREIAVERVHFPRDGAGHRLRAKRSADVQNSGTQGILSQRYKEKRSRLLADARILRVLGDAYNLHPASFKLQSLTKGAMALPVALGHGFVHHRDQRGLFVIGAGEFAATNEWDAHSD